VASRTQIVCLCEGEKASADGVFIHALLRSLKPAWVRRDGSNMVRLRPCGGRKALIAAVPGELRACLARGADTTLMVWADCDHDCGDGEALKARFWEEAQSRGVGRDDFDRIVFIFAKDRIENWIEFLHTGVTNELQEGPRVRHGKEAAEAARKLARLGQAGRPVDGMPPSLRWSCRNWRALVERMT
jgi:hypothetical protein